MAEQAYEYILEQPEHGQVGLGPTEDRGAVWEDLVAWENGTRHRGTIMRRPVGDWEPDPDQGWRP